MTDEYSGGDSPYAWDWAAGAFAPPGVIWIGEIPLPQARELVDQGWSVVGAPLPPLQAGEPAPALPEPIPTPPPQPPPIEPPPIEPANDPAIEPRTPITPEPLTPAGEPTFPPAPQLPEPIEPPPGVRLPVPPDIPMGPVAGVGIGEILVGIGGLLWPTGMGPEPDVLSPPPVLIPPPPVALPEPSFPLPEPYTPAFPYPQPPELIVVTPSAPPYSPPVPQQQPEPLPWIIPPFFPFPTPPRPVASAPPAPLPSAPPMPLPPPPVPITPTAPPAPIASPPSMPGVPSLPTSGPGATPSPLTPFEASPVESPQQCETPQERDRRRREKRDACRKLVRIKVKAHYRKVCLSEALEHEAKRYRKKLVRKYITKPAGKLGQRATDWVLKELGLTPYAEQAKDVKKRVSDLTKRQKRYRVEIPGTHIEIDPVDLIPSTPKGKP